jgi:ketosteroid isomerase-like protein
MPNTTPEETVRAFFDAFNRGDLEAAIALYEPNAILVAQPHQVVKGHAAIRGALAGFFSMKPILIAEKKRLIKAGDVALSMIRWKLDGTSQEGAPVHMEGTTSEILRRRSDGSWLFAIDNPWGAAVLE